MTRQLRYGVVLVLLASCGRDRSLREADARNMIEQHPRFKAGQTLTVPARFCGAPPAAEPATGGEHDPLEQLRELQQNQIITIEHHAAAPGDCRQNGSTPRELFTVQLTNVAPSFHPEALENGRGWTFVLARRRFVTLDRIEYNSQDPPTMAHVQYSWRWEPQLIGQLLKLGSIEQGASATFVRDDGEWVVRQPGM